MRAAIQRLEILAALAAAALASPAFALGPSEVFAKAAPGVVGVRAIDGQGKPLAFGSAVVIGPEKLVTSCHVLAKAARIELLQDGSAREAILEQADVERDLCVISAKGLVAPVAALAAQPARIGQRVYVIGVPTHLELSLAEGMVSGTRSPDPSLPPIQTTAPLSPGFSGAGLFNDQAQLVGIATLNVARGSIPATVNFALPAAWLAEIGPRSEQQLAERRRPAAPATVQAAVASMPAPGARWRYRYLDRKYNTPDRFFAVEILGVAGHSVQERFSVEGGEITQAPVEAEPLRFIARPLSNSVSVVELAPYAAELYSRAAAAPAGYPSADGAIWTTEVASYAEERVTVLAGTYAAIRVQVNGTAFTSFRGHSSFAQPARFRYTAWYSPDMRRYVQITHLTWNTAGQQVADELVQLVEYDPPPAVKRPAATRPSRITTLDLEPIDASGSGTAPGKQR